MIDRVRDTDYVETLYEIAPELRSSMPGRLDSAALPALERVAFLGGHPPAGMLAFHQVEAMAERIGAAQLADVKARLHPDDVINIQYTSGTTGFPKACSINHETYALRCLNYGMTKGMNKEERARMTLPVHFHAGRGSVMSILYLGGTIFSQEKFDE